MDTTSDDWRRLFEQSAVPTCVFDERTHAFLAANDAFVTQYGWARDELARMRMVDVRPEDQRDRFEQTLRKFTESGSRESVFYSPSKHRTKDGRLLDIRGYATRLDFAARPAILAVLIDETVRRGLETRWREAESLWRSLADTSPDMVTIVALDGTIQYINHPEGVFRGRTIVGGKVWDFTPDGAASRIREILERVTRTREAIVYEAPGYVPSGGLGWYEARVIPLVIEGNLERVIFISIDITERKRAAEALQASERRFRALVEHGSDCIVLFGEDNLITYVSPAQLRALGYEAQEMIGKPARDFVHPDDRVQADDAGPNAADDQSVAGALRLRHKDGSWRWHEGTSTNLLHDPAVRAVVSNRRDVTDQRRLEEQLRQSQKLEAIGLLAGGIAHDFNNLLGVILGYAEVAARTMPESHPGRGALREVGAAAQRGAELTRKLLAFSRKQLIQVRPTDLDATVAEFARMLRRIVGEDIELVVEPAGEPVIVNADLVQLEQVLLNLCTNARQAMPNGGRLRLSTRAQSIDGAFAQRNPWARVGQFAEIVVTDTGVGMDDATRARAFEPFFTTKTEGTGLGLATVYGIVEQHGGFVHLSSEPAAGTTVHVYLPTAPGPAIAVRRSNHDVVADARGHETILVAEDEPALRALTETTLTDLGYRVIVTSDGEQAVREYETHAAEVALVVLDVIMPRLGAREAYLRMRRIRDDVKVLFASGYAPESTRLLEAMSGARFRLLEKPFTPQELAARVRRAIDE
jgi:PAS domain S-box-containing protein